MTKEYISVIFTGDKYSCTGCGACSQICRHSAIEMQPDEEGFLFPTVNKDKCVCCGLCDSICPVVGNKQANAEQEQHCYIATTKHKEYYKESASIGICTMLSDYVVSQGGVVYGCYLDENDWTAYHIGVRDKAGVQRLRNSKYLQSNTKQTFTEVRTNLIDGKLVLYIGTPCQIAGLKAYLRKDYDNLYTIDIICHGTFSPKLMPLEVKYWENKFHGKIKHFGFRSRKVYKHQNGGMINFDLQTEDGNTQHIERHASSSPSYRCFAYSGDGQNYNIRLSCYSCHFRDTYRYGDITVGDPWFINPRMLSMKYSPYINVRLSLYSCNTSKGQQLLSYVNHLLDQKEYSREHSFCQPAVKPTHREIPALRSELFSKLGSCEYGTLVEQLLKCNLNSAHEAFEKTYRFMHIKNIIKHLLKRL